MSLIITKPWGQYENLFSGSKFLFKKITIKPNESISHQYHNHREETWIITSGSGILELDLKKTEVKEGDRIEIKVKQLHRITSGNDGLEFVELQYGDMISEEDIVRIEDKYGRK